MMKRNWIVLVFALLALASCSVEKRVYQPGYYIQWNHFAKEDAEQDAERDVAQDAERDVAQDVAQDATQDVAQDVAQDATQDVAQDAAQDASRDVTQVAAQDASRDLSKSLETDVPQIKSLQRIIRAVSPFQLNPVKAHIDLGKSKHSDLETMLLILLALFLPALTIFLMEGFSKNFWIALLLMICAFSLPFLAVVVRAILETIAIIVAIAVVLHYV
jgi:uncharacterized membrane protein YqaE (UPF0057 family)